MKRCLSVTKLDSMTMSEAVSLSVDRNGLGPWVHIESDTLGRFGVYGDFDSPEDFDTAVQALRDRLGVENVAEIVPCPSNYR